MDLERLPRAGEEVKTSAFVRTIGGGAVITAVAAARLGVRVALWSALSDAAVRRLARERVRITNLRRRREPHAITVALSTPGNGRSSPTTAATRRSTAGCCHACPGCAPPTRISRSSRRTARPGCARSHV